MTYATLFAVQKTPPPPSLRPKDRDWDDLSPDEQQAVIEHADGRLPLDHVPLRGQVFLRRHGGV